MDYHQLLTQYPKVPLRLILKYELIERKKKNRRYSMRAFAKALDIPASTLSRFMKDERELSIAMLKKFCVALGIPAQKVSEIDAPEKTKATTKQYTYLDYEKYPELKFRDFALIQVLELYQCRGDENILANSLEVSVEELCEMKNRLEAYQLLRTEGDFWLPTFAGTSFMSLGKNSIAQHQISMMESAIESIQRGPARGRRSHSGIVLTFIRLVGWKRSKKSTAFEQKCRVYLLKKVKMTRLINSLFRSIR